MYPGGYLEAEPPINPPHGQCVKGTPSHGNLNCQVRFTYGSKRFLGGVWSERNPVDFDERWVGFPFWHVGAQTFKLPADKYQNCFKSMHNPVIHVDQILFSPQYTQQCRAETQSSPSTLPSGNVRTARTVMANQIDE